jgi:hypothetical protein
MFTKCKDVMDKVFALFGWADINSAGNKDASISSRLTIPIVRGRKQFLLFHLSFIGLICSLLREALLNHSPLQHSQLLFPSLFFILPPTFNLAGTTP